MDQFSPLRGGHATFQPSVNNNQSNGNAGVLVRRTLVHPNSSNTIPPSTPANHTADRKLYEQFIFFKEEFIKTAMRMDVAIPMDIMEERTNNLKLFIELNGPKYVFQVIQSNILSMQLLRPGLSLMVTTLALFKRILPKHLLTNSDYPPPPLWFSYEKHHNLSADEIWASQMVSKISDSVTVTGCVSILLATHNPTIQELVINLIAGLITISEDAITQMLQIPNILYTQTNKKIPTTETSRDKLLQMHLKRISLRLDGPNWGNNLGTATNDSRRNSHAGSGEMNTPGNNTTTNPNRFSMSMRGGMMLDRSNSKLSTSRKGDDKKYDSQNDEGKREEELYPEEFQSCLSYILSVTLMQKNRHLLLAGCADVIIAMTRNAPSSMCEYVAKVPTGQLPMIDLQKNTNNNRGHSLKHLYTNQAQHVIEPLHVNPLGAKVIDWAGVRIPLKFLQRYHQIFGTASGGAGTAAAPTGAGAGITPAGGQRSGNSSSDAYSENLKAEYRYAHNRTLLAISSLLVASHEIVAYVVQLPGAIEVIRLSASVYSDEELQSRLLTSMTGAHSVPASRVNTGDPDNRSLGSRGGGRSRPETQSLPGVIITALNSLQLEKQHQIRLKAILNHNNANTVVSQSNSRRSSTSLASLGPHQQLGPPAQNSLSKSPEKQSKLKPLPNSQSKIGSTLTPSIVTHGTSFTGATTSLIHGSEPIQQNLSQPVQLTSQMAVKFNASYTKETEEYNLYIQNQNDNKLYQQALSSPLQFYASKQISAQSRGPLQFQNTSKPDPLLSSSLKEMDDNIRQTLLQPQQPKLNPSKSPVMFGSDVLRPFESNTLGNSDSYLDGGVLGSNTGMAGQLAPVSPWSHGLSASRDFFGRLPTQPHVPRRIEPKDVIIENEAISKIRKKFQLLGENAVRRIESSGTEFRNGKNFVPIEERARRIYLPAKSAFFGSPRSSKEKGSENAQPSAKEKKTLQSLEVFDRFDQPDSNPPSEKTGAFGTAAPTPAWKNVNDLYDTSEKGDDNNSSENVSSANDMMNVYRVRLDNIEFDEQELFDNFKPIFDFNNPDPEYQADYPTADQNEKRRNVPREDYELYGINDPSSPTNAGGGYNSNYYKLKSSLQVDQTSDLLL